MVVSVNNANQILKLLMIKEIVWNVESMSIQTPMVEYVKTKNVLQTIKSSKRMGVVKRVTSTRIQKKLKKENANLPRCVKCTTGIRS